MLKTRRFTIVAALLQGLFIVLFAVFVRYPKMRLRVPDRDRAAKDDKEAHIFRAEMAEQEVAKYYPCKYGTSLLRMLSIKVCYYRLSMRQLCYSFKYETSMLYM